jgi:phospholipid transport system substrate-binding protein
MRLGILIGGLALLLGTAAPTLADDSAATARNVIENVVHQALAVLRDPKLSTDDKRLKIRQIAYDNISFDIMARLSLGRYFRGITDDQHTRYSAEFKQHVTNTYGHTTDNYSDEDVAVTGDRKEANGDWTVQTRITGTRNGQPNQEVAKVDYRLRQTGGQWKIIDLTIEGVSMIANFRSQFDEIMANGGIEQLIQLLHQKNVDNAK